MKTLVASALMLLAPALAWSNPAATLVKPAAKASAKAAPKAAPAKTVAKPKATKKDKTTVAKASPPSSRTQLRSGAAQVAAGLAAAEAALTPEELQIAQLVHTGHIACELGASVDIQPDAQSPGRFHVQGKGFKYHMAPVATSTGAVRLEDASAGAVWLQIANKSMLMNQKLGQRMADECMSPQQFAVAEGFKKAPPRSLLDGPANP
ncbi:hypothetical protein SAMN05428957_105290 [Oryzisolibacter propanilivorax]|uniref:Uncharacterized protein n=1 Tax=Oryzisolibacter propanilivorax TaxID=1527607 RepID=A0A1G9T2K7_9BURK|nr:hypothetical protein [Oryzisolibacter propanilivorax]SDM41911.1 hypothetical protein SAMN05428957_105290 [Oryzisolibacter propanilivorax]